MASAFPLTLATSKLLGIARTSYAAYTDTRDSEEITVQTKRLPSLNGCLLLRFLLVILAGYHPAVSFAAENQDLMMLNSVVLEPGDVINFKGGGGAFLGVGEYGHTGMYLGKDPATQEPLFLDFTTAKKGRAPGEFRGRISTEMAFLNDNIGHAEFNVYRLHVYRPPGVATLDQDMLLASARDIAKDKTFGAMIDCANAASRALSLAAHIPIVEIRPDGFAEDFRFDAVSLTVNIKDALGELRGEKAPASNSDISFLKTVANTREVPRTDRDTFAAQEYAAWGKARDEERRARIEQWHADHDEEVRASQEQFADMKRRWEYLRTMTGFACSDPDTLERLGRDGKAPGVSLENLDLDWVMNWSETGEVQEPVANSCQEYILTAIQNANGLTSGASMIAMARRYRSEHPGHIQKFFTSVADFLGSVASIFPTLHSGGGGSGGQTRSHDEPSQDTRHSPDNWSSLNQLRGISGFQ
jgi:hypothetical protein